MLLFPHRLDALHHTRRLDGMACRAHPEHVVGSRDSELLEEDVGHLSVVVLPGVDQRVTAVRYPPVLADL
jgi:hypothetical protein